MSKFEKLPWRVSYTDATQAVSATGELLASAIWARPLVEFVNGLARDRDDAQARAAAFQKGACNDVWLIAELKRRHARRLERLRKAALRYRRQMKRAQELRASAEAQTASLIHENERLRALLLRKLLKSAGVVTFVVGD